MSTDKEQQDQFLELRGHDLTRCDQALLVRMLPDVCCAKCKYWKEIEPPAWPDRKIVFAPWAGDDQVSCLVTLFYHVDWRGHCRRFPPTFAPSDLVVVSGTADWAAHWPITECSDHCGEFTLRNHPTR